MNKKIVGIFIVMLLIGTVLPVLGTQDNYVTMSTSLSGGWIKHFEGTSWGHNVIQTSDGGYLIAGGTDYSGNSDALLIKVDSDGNLEWEEKFGGLGWDAFEGLCELPDGDFIASGTDSSKGFLVKTNSNGELIWQKNYDYRNGYCISLCNTIDGGFAMSGFVYPQDAEVADAWLIKTDNEGNELWSKTFGGGESESFHSLYETTDGGFILSGWVLDATNIIDEGWAVKTDSEGVVEWDQTYDSGQDIIGLDKIDFFHCGIQTSDGGYIFTGCGYMSLLGDKGQTWLVKVDSEGNEMWTQDFGTPFSNEVSMWVEETNDGGFIVASNYFGLGTLLNFIKTGSILPLWSKIWLIKTDSNGNLEWDAKIEQGFGRCVRQAIDGGYIAVGQKGSYGSPEGILLIKTDENGNFN